MRNGTGGLDVVGAVHLAKYGASSTWKLEAMLLAHVPSPPSSTLHAARGSMSMTKSMLRLSARLQLGGGWSNRRPHRVPLRRRERRHVRSRTSLAQPCNASSSALQL